MESTPATGSSQHCIVTGTWDGAHTNKGGREQRKADGQRRDVAVAGLGDGRRVDHHDEREGHDRLRAPCSRLARRLCGAGHAAGGHASGRHAAGRRRAAAWSCGASRAHLPPEELGGADLDALGVREAPGARAPAHRRARQQPRLAGAGASHRAAASTGRRVQHAHDDLGTVLGLMLLCALERQQQAVSRHAHHAAPSRLPCRACPASARGRAPR